MLVASTSIRLISFNGIEGLTFKGEYTHTDILTSVGVTYAYSPLFGKPTDQAGLDIDYQYKLFEIGTTITYVSARPDYDFTYGVDQPVTLNEYYLVNLRASYQVDPHVKLFARVDNLFNEFYEQVYGYGTPGLSAYGGTKISF
jgi:vitamin B12 transporter